ncbi:MAG: hypothetical protein GY811_28915 [Myxococcales bacterium]|nr:hypothetical protein [Myxococcales bacterium]
MSVSTRCIATGTDRAQHEESAFTSPTDMWSDGESDHTHGHQVMKTLMKLMKLMMSVMSYLGVPSP